MDFANFVQKNYRDVHEATERGWLNRLGKAMDRSGGIEKLLAGDDPVLEQFPSEIILRVADAHRDYEHWKEAATRLRRSMAQSGLALPDGTMALAQTPHELDALERIAGMCGRSGFPDHSSWAEGVRAHLELWRACVEMSLSHGSAQVELVDPDHPDAPELEAYATKHAILCEIKSYRWLAIRRGQRSGALAVSVELPINAMRRQTADRLPLLGLMAQKSGAEAVCAELIEKDIDAVVMNTFEKKARYEALSSARRAYLGLLSTPPLQVEKAISVSIGGDDKIGIAVLDKKGDIVAHELLQAGEDPRGPISAIIAEHEPGAAILPISLTEKRGGNWVEEAIAALPTQRVHDAAVGEARKNVSLPAAIGAAVVLARRAIKPGREWGRVNPLSLSLGDYPRELDKEELLGVLAESRALSSWERRKRKSAKRAGAMAVAPGRTAAVLPSGRRLNPLVKTIRDLKPGMTVEGVITNLTKFGAFVNIGLPTEGMIHVSQLSSEFVDDPAQVVRVGQQVTARVLEVVPEKQRIALTLKPLTERPGRDNRFGPAPMGPPRPPGPGDNRSSPPKSRSAALADLDALFKK